MNISFNNVSDRAYTSYRRNNLEKSCSSNVIAKELKTAQKDTTNHNAFNELNKPIYRQVDLKRLTPDIARKVTTASQVATNGFFTESKKDVFDCVYGLEPILAKNIPGVLEKNILPNEKTICFGTVRAQITEHTKSNDLYINFSGLTPKTSARDIKFITKNLFGHETKEMKSALSLVKHAITFKPDKNIVITGHSMGGALAAYCGIKLKCKVVSFNGMGLRSSLIKKIARKDEQYDITNINTNKDWLSQFVQPKILTQPGERYKVEQFSGHGLYYSKAEEQYFLTDTLQDIGSNK